MKKQKLRVPVGIYDNEDNKFNMIEITFTKEDKQKIKAASEVLLKNKAFFSITILCDVPTLLCQNEETGRVKRTNEEPNIVHSHIEVRDNNSFNWIAYHKRNCEDHFESYEMTIDEDGSIEI